MPALQCAGFDDRTLPLPGLEAEAAAIPFLTIDYGRLRDVWLPAAQLEGDACEEGKEFAAAARCMALDLSRPHALREKWYRRCRAREALHYSALRDWEVTVEKIRKRGGLLHVGCAV